MKKVLPLRDKIKQMKKTENRLKDVIDGLTSDNQRLERRIEKIGVNNADETFSSLLEMTRTSERQLKKFKEMLSALLGKLAMMDDDKLMKTYLRNTEVSLREDDWEVIRRMTNNLRVTGTCDHCGISTYGRKGHGRPEPSSMPCGISQCPYEGNVVMNFSQFMRKYK